VKALALLAALLTASAAAAQPVATLPRADVQAAIGWQNLRSDDSTLSRNDWINALAVADVAGGWYWTEHWRTQIDGSLGSTARHTRLIDRSDDKRSAFQTIATDVQPATFAISQQYQFFHNAVFHPHVGAGLLVRHEHLHDDFSPVARFDPATGQTVVLEEGHTGDRSRVDVAALADVGFKAYLSQRAFFTTDARVTIRRGVDGILFRFGFGVDF
jgi:hypothetical protein